MNDSSFLLNYEHEGIDMTNPAILAVILGVVAQVGLWSFYVWFKRSEKKRKPPTLPSSTV